MDTFPVGNDPGERCNLLNTKCTMKGLIFRNKWIVIGVLTGAIAGYAYYHFVGCNSGTCMISSKPLNSTLYFSVMGGLLFSIFKREPDKKPK